MVQTYEMKPEVSLRKKEFEQGGEAFVKKRGGAACRLQAEV
jgi:hypothetical protein